MSLGRRASRGLRRYVVAGVLVWLPVLATLWVLGFIIELMDRTLLLLPEGYDPRTLVGFQVPGLGILFALLVLLTTGLLVTNLVGRRLVAFWEDLLQRIPLVRSVYGGVKSFTESVFSTSNNSFRRVVLIEYPRPGMWTIGFMTAEDIHEVSLKTGEQQACIYVPTTPNPTSGLIVMVPRSQVIDLDMSVDVAMKMIVTLGVVVPPAPAAPPKLAKPAA